MVISLCLLIKNIYVDRITIKRLSLSKQIERPLVRNQCFIVDLESFSIIACIMAEFSDVSHVVAASGLLVCGSSLLMSVGRHMQSSY